MGNVQVRLAAGLLFVVVLVFGVQTLHAPKTSSPVTTAVLPVEATPETMFPVGKKNVVLVTTGEPLQLTGQSYPRLSGHLAYWFGWFAFFPPTSVYGQ